MTASFYCCLALLGSDKTGDKIVLGARDQLSWGTVYDGRYIKLSYPKGDPPRKIGVCSDVVVRSLRLAGLDLQVLIHEDMKRAWRAYPRYPGVTLPDRNIDHRRVKNQQVFFARHGRKLPLKSDWRPGDFVTWKLDSGLDHIGVLTDRAALKGGFWVIHNLSTPTEEDCLNRWRVTGHYRFPK